MIRHPLLIFACAFAAVAVLGWEVVQLTDDDSPRVGTAGTTTTPSPPPAPSAPTPAATASPPPEPGLPSRAALARLVRHVSAGAGGRVQAAVVQSGTMKTLAAASDGSTQTPFRMWSVSKAATAIALLEAHGWTDEHAPRLPPDTASALDNALVGSGDCAQRQIVVELQELSGGAEPARRRIEGVLARAGASHATVFPREAVAGIGCRPYLEQHSRTPDPYRSALQVGTAEWTVRDAARFGLALGDGTYAKPITDRMLSLLRERKRKSDDPFANGLDVTTDPQWGAGLALDGLRPAYKAGWGGSSGETLTFVNEQAIYVVDPEGRAYGIGVTFEGPDIPIRDDPALTNAPRALDRLLRGLHRLLQLG